MMHRLQSQSWAASQHLSYSYCLAQFHGPKPLPKTAFLCWQGTQRHSKNWGNKPYFWCFLGGGLFLVFFIALCHVETLPVTADAVVRNICSATCLPELIGFLQHSGTSLTHQDPALSRFSRPEFTPHFICTTSLKKTAIATDHWPLSISSVRRATLMWSADRVGPVAQFFSLLLEILFLSTPPLPIIMQIRFIWNSKLAKETLVVGCASSILSSAATHCFHEKTAGGREKKVSVTLMNRERCWCVDRKCPSVIDYV